MAKKQVELIKSIKLVSYWDDHYYQATLLNGEKGFLTSVTTYLNALSSDFLPRWRGDVGNREADLRMNEAADRGSRLHYAYTLFARGGVVLFQPPEWQSPDVELKEQNEILIRQCKANDIPFFILHNQDEMVQMNRIAAWFEIVKPEVEASELIIYSLTHDFAGTLDLKFSTTGGKFAVNGADGLELPAGRYIADFKTGQENDSHALQLAAYLVADEECLGEKVDGAMIIYTNTKTKKGIEGLKTSFFSRAELDSSFETFKRIQEIWKFQHPNAAPKLFSFKSVEYRPMENDILTGFVQPKTQEVK
jgi:hypothetical protein